MEYALNVLKDNRIHSALVVLPNGHYDGMPIVNALPEGDISEYRYIDGQYIHDPKPVAPAPEPAPSLESRVSSVESDVASLTAAIEKGLAL